MGTGSEALPPKAMRCHRSWYAATGAHALPPPLRPCHQSSGAAARSHAPAAAPLRRRRAPFAAAKTRVVPNKLTRSTLSLQYRETAAVVAVGLRLVNVRCTYKKHALCLFPLIVLTDTRISYYHPLVVVASCPQLHYRKVHIHRGYI